MSDFCATVFIIIGLTLNVFGCIALVRFLDVYSRLQTAIKCVTIGTCFMLLGTLMIKGFTSAGIKAFLCIVFLFLTTPVIAHAIARAALSCGVKLQEGAVCDKYREDEDKKNEVS